MIGRISGDILATPSLDPHRQPPGWSLCDAECAHSSGWAEMEMGKPCPGARLRHPGPPQTLLAWEPGPPAPQSPLCSPPKVGVKKPQPSVLRAELRQVSRPCPASGHIRGLPEYPTHVLVGGHRGHIAAGPDSACGWGGRGTGPDAWGSRGPSANLTLSPRPLPTSPKNRASFELEIGGVSCSVLLRHRL